MASPDATVIPWQVAVELLARFRKWESAGKMAADDVRERFREFIAIWNFAMPTPSIFETSFRLHDRYSLSHWDSMLVAACREPGVTRLYSEDMQDGADYDGVKIENPFA